MKDEPETLAEALPAQIERVQNEVMPAYIAIGNPGMIALCMMRESIRAAHRAMMKSDPVAMIRAYEYLRGFHV